MMSSMKKIDPSDAADGPVVSEGGRSPSTRSTGHCVPAAPTAAPAPNIGPLAPGQSWSVARKREVVLRLLRGESVELLSRELGLPIFKLEQWRRKADAALDGGTELVGDVAPGHGDGDGYGEVFGPGIDVDVGHVPVFLADSRRASRLSRIGFQRAEDSASPLSMQSRST